MNRDVFDATKEFAAKLFELVDLPLYDQSSRLVTSDVACSMSLEHWSATLQLMQSALLPSAVTVHRAQFEALLRSIWILYAANDQQIDKLVSDLNLETDQTAKNLPQVADMLTALEKNGPAQAFEALTRFKDNSWKALNSYAHAGIHPIRRHAEGYPIPLIESITKNANGLAVVAVMQASVLSGAQPLQREILDLASKYPECMPPPL
ncbi:MAG: hypothetical protein Q8O33_18545 [Pseudomonadota bacterium]|nr:hypothetical protein [Pseudomonadota bacterium]